MSVAGIGSGKAGIKKKSGREKKVFVRIGVGVAASSGVDVVGECGELCFEEEVVL